MKNHRMDLNLILYRKRKYLSLFDTMERCLLEVLIDNFIYLSGNKRVSVV